MTRTSVASIGFDRVVEHEWLDAVAGRLAAGDEPTQARAKLNAVLSHSIAGTARGGGRDKTGTVVSRIWIAVPPQAQELRSSALREFVEGSAGDRIALHWAMCVAAYPFFLDVAATVGASVALSGSCAIGHVRRRVTDKWGDRSTLRRAVPRVLRSMVQWGALEETKPRGAEYRPIPKAIPLSDGPALVLIEAILMSRGGSRPLAQLLTDPAAFPFALRVNPATLRSSSRLELYRAGDRADYVELRGAHVAKG